MNDDFMAQFRGAFLEESGELVDTMEQILLRLDTSRVDGEDLHTLFRAAHSIKGNSSTFGFPEIAVFTHDLEGCLDKVRNGSVPMTSGLVERLLAAVDIIRRHLDSASRSEPVPPALKSDQERLLEELKRGDVGPGAGVPAALILPPAAVLPPALGYQIRFVAPKETFRRGLKLERILKDLEHLGRVQFQLDPGGLPAAEGLDPETCYLAWNIRLETQAEREALDDVFEFVAEPHNLRIERILEEALAVGTCAPLAANPETPAEPPRPAATERAEGATLRVSAEKIDQLMDLMGELVTAEVMLAQSSHLRDSANGQTRFSEALQFLERQIRELQSVVMGIRMVPVELVFSRFPRLVRDLGRQLGKEVDLVLEGQNTELDKAFIERLVDALDHGLETAEVRLAHGKSPRGRLGLRASSRGGHILIEVADDGGGLDRERILKKARERNLPLPAEASDGEVYNLLFLPGFSTSAIVTDISGRGVGLDVVRQNILALGGRVEVESRRDEGTTFRLILPLTRAILDGLLIRVGEEIYVIPLESVVESFQPKPAAIQMLERGRAVINVRGRYLPIVQLHELLGTGPAGNGRKLLVVVESEGRQAALTVDELLGQQQVVLKSLETHYQKIPGISGATILGDGRVALILDVHSLITLEGREAGEA